MVSLSGEVVEVGWVTTECVKLLLVTVVRMSSPESAAAALLGVFDLPLFHTLAHLSTGGKTIDIEIRCPEELAEILRTLQLHLNVLHVPVEVLDQHRTALAILL